MILAYIRCLRVLLSLFTYDRGDDTSEREFYADPHNFGDLLPEFEADFHDESMDVDPICELRPAADRDLFSAVVEEQATMMGHTLNPGRIDEQVRDAVFKLGRKDNVRMPWESWPVKPTDHLKHLGPLSFASGWKV